MPTITAQYIKGNIEEVEMEDLSIKVKKLYDKREKAKGQQICNNDMVAADAIKHHIFQQLCNRTTVHFMRRY